MKTIYLAGASLEVELVAGYMRRLEAEGWTVTLDWTKSVLENRVKGLTDIDLSEEERKRLASADLRAAAAADVFWLLAPESPSLGCWIEYGFVQAASDRAAVIVSGQARHRTIFASLADAQYETHEEAFEALIEKSQMKFVIQCSFTDTDGKAWRWRLVAPDAEEAARLVRIVRGSGYEAEVKS